MRKQEEGIIGNTIQLRRVVGHIIKSARLIREIDIQIIFSIGQMNTTVPDKFYLNFGGLGE